MRGALLLLFALAASLPAAELPPSEFRARRADAMVRIPDGILLVPSRAFVFHSDQDYLASFQQGPVPQKAPPSALALVRRVGWPPRLSMRQTA